MPFRFCRGAEWRRENVSVASRSDPRIVVEVEPNTASRKVEPQEVTVSRRTRPTYERARAKSNGSTSRRKVRQPRQDAGALRARPAVARCVPLRPASADAYTGRRRAGNARGPAARGAARGGGAERGARHVPPGVERAVVSPRETSAPGARRDREPCPRAVCARRACRPPAHGPWPPASRRHTWHRDSPCSLNGLVRAHMYKARAGDAATLGRRGPDSRQDHRRCARAPRPHSGAFHASSLSSSSSSLPPAAAIACRRMLDLYSAISRS